MSRLRRWLLVPALALAVTASVGGDTRAARLTLEDLVSVPTTGNPVLSPDGKQFALVRDGQIALMPSDGG